METIAAVKFSKALNKGQDILMIDSHIMFGCFISCKNFYNVGDHKPKLVPMRIFLMRRFNWCGGWWYNIH